jgi:hypothetical protein
MILDRRERAFRHFSTRNAFVEDAADEDRLAKLNNPWTEAEKAIFVAKYLKHPKNFRKIASSLPNKSVADCVSYYYASKMSGLYYKTRRTSTKTKGKDAAAAGAAAPGAAGAGPLSNPSASPTPGATPRAGARSGKPRSGISRYVRLSLIYPKWG